MLGWIIRRYRKHKLFNKHRNKILETIEDQNEIYDDNLDLITPERPVAYVLMCIWGCLETLTLAVLMVERTRDWPENFLHGFCFNAFCDGFVFKAIVHRFVYSILMVIGAMNVGSHFFLVYFLLLIFFLSGNYDFHPTLVYIQYSRFISIMDVDSLIVLHM